MTPAEAGAYFAAPFQPSRAVLRHRGPRVWAPADLPIAVPRPATRVEQVGTCAEPCRCPRYRCCASGCLAPYFLGEPREHVCGVAA